VQSTPIENLDPDLQPYLGLHGSRGSLHPAVGPCFICEGRYLVEEALASHRAGQLKVLSVLTGPSATEAFQQTLPEGIQHLTADKAFLERLLGFSFHRGMLCCVAVPEAPDASIITSAKSLVVVPRLDNVDNLGQILRSAAALGIDAVLAGQGPGLFDRRTVRVSMGAAWKIPVLQSEDPSGVVRAWRDHAPGSEIVGAALVEGSLDARAWQPTPRTALVLGPEDQGLDEKWLALCDRHVRIPMARGIDSLNVAAAGAILMHRISA